jgi:hypothetical protein
VEQRIGVALRRDSCGQQRAHLAGEPQATVMPRDVKRLYTEPIAYEHHPAPGDVEGGECIQTVEPRRRSVSPARKCMQHRFGVAPAGPGDARELLAQLEMVERLAVVGQPPHPVRGRHRLVPGWRRVDYRESGVSQRDLACDRDPAVVRAAVVQESHHSLHGRAIGRAARAGDASCDPAHAQATFVEAMAGAVVRGRRRSSNDRSSPT